MKTANACKLIVAGFLIVLTQLACSGLQDITGSASAAAASEITQDASEPNHGGQAAAADGEHGQAANQGQPAQNNSCEFTFSLDGSASVVNGSHFEPGESFSVTWPLLNSGNCAWTADFEAVLIDGDALGADSTFPLGSVVEPGETFELTLDLIAPAQDGEAVSVWKLMTANGQRFGLQNPGNAPLRLIIIVSSAANNNNAPGASLEVSPNLDMTNFPNVYGNGFGLTMQVNQCFDFEVGEVVACSNTKADFRYNSIVFQGGFITPLNDTRFATSQSDVPDEDTCAAAAYYGLHIDPPQQDVYYCFETELDGETAYGWLLLTNVNNGGITFNYLVFEPDASGILVAAAPELNLSLFILSSAEQETLLVNKCYDLVEGEKAACNGSAADIKYLIAGGQATIQALTGTMQGIGTWTEENAPTKADCQAKTYMSGYLYIYSTPDTYVCFQTEADGDTVYGWLRVTGYNNGGMTFDYTLWQP